MSDYMVSSTISKNEWQIDSKARKYQFSSDMSDKKGGPTPVEYLCGALNSCIGISSAMMIKVHHLDIRNFEINTVAQTEQLGHGMSKVARIQVNISFDTSLTEEEQEKFLKRVLEVSTVYQTLKTDTPIKVEII